MMAVSNLGGMLSALENSTMNALAVGKDPKAMIEDEIRRIQAGVAADRAKTISTSNCPTGCQLMPGRIGWSTGGRSRHR